ncbi:ribonuclease D [Bifidobacterium bohemicum]|uniref:Ribonuclease D n=1 Tax=Bifidobacterium bohemicum DSM 22767 TaxID=1437606 RepID=A0A086ZG24_9BIFI|nr:HRDC domain-containing protein [Bifidobacterium bohemicum]KFI45474.1 ribonuclease D [Bifidobacterium bohemicum DSM 22767]SCB72192.1 ribonuclease D [Bifidobacterium bohemicum]
MITEPRLLAEPRGGVPEVTDDLEGFDRACAALAAGTGSLAADAERASGYRYSHEDWLVQFKRTGSGIWLLDPVMLTKMGADWNRFNQAVGETTWILHDALMDLPGFADIGLRPKALFDTEIAARILGVRHFGLAAVTERYLGVTLAKEHSAADWSYRPLPRDWRDYAALDVELLIELETAMREDLEKSGKMQWAEEEFAYALEQGMGPQPVHPVPWMHISHFTVLSRDRQGQAVAKALWTKRDELARQYDIEPGLLLSDAAIIEAARRKPHNGKEFRQIRSLNERVRMHTGSEQDKMFERYAPIQRSVKPNVWKHVIEQALELGPKDWPTLPRPRKDDPNANAPKSMKYWKAQHPDRYRRLKAVQSVVGTIAEDTHTPSEIVIKPQILRNLCWRDNAAGLDVAAFLREQGAREWQISLIAASVSRVII